MPVYRIQPGRTSTDSSGRQICEVFGAADGHEDLSVAWLMMPAGSRRPEERSDRTEVLIVLSGRARATIDGRADEIGAGHALYVPRGSAWRIENTGREPLVCYSICSPAPTH